MPTKDTRVNIKLSTELKEKFEKYCVDNGTTISDEIRRYMTQCTKDQPKEQQQDKKKRAYTVTLS